MKSGGFGRGERERRIFQVVSSNLVVVWLQNSRLKPLVSYERREKVRGFDTSEGLARCLGF